MKLENKNKTASVQHIKTVILIKNMGIHLVELPRRLT